MRALSALLFLSLSVVARDVRAEWNVATPLNLGPGEHAQEATIHLKAGTRLVAVPGELPNEEHPHGTVLFGWTLEGIGLVVTEWDVAAGRTVRQLRIGLRGGDVQGMRVGDEVHLTSSDKDGGYWIVVDARRFQVVRKVRVSDLGAARVASDGALTLIAKRLRSSGWAISSFDRNGRALGSWPLDVSSPGEMPPRDDVPWWGPEMGVLDGRAYVVSYDGPGAAIVELSREMTPLRRLSLGSHPSTPTMLVRDGSLFVTRENFVGGEDELLEVSPDLQVRTIRSAEKYIGMFDIAANGQVVADCSYIFSRTLRIRAPMNTLPACASVLWSGDTPVAVSTHMEPSGEVAISWVNPDFLADR